MKSTIVVCALVVLACLCLQAEAKAVCEIDGVQLKEGVNHYQCSEITCHAGVSMTRIGCAPYRCGPGKQIGYRDTDLSKPYPACCPGPICAP